MGSYAYGVATGTSDMDIYGVCIPAKDEIFPHLRGEIIGFGTQKRRFEQYQESCFDANHRVAGISRQYDFSVYNIVKYFSLCMENNPNMLDSLFVPRNCITHTTQIGEMIREKRHIFLHKGLWHKFKGYSYSQLNKAKRNTAEGSRQELIETYGYDIKAAYHVVRLLEECQQALTEGNIDLQRSADTLRAIRDGQWTWERLQEYFAIKEASLEKIYHESNLLPYSPREDEIKELLLNCLEHHFGRISDVLVYDKNMVRANLNKINDALQVLLNMDFTA